MKFLFVGTNRENTGAATHFVTLVQALLAAGHQVTAIVAADSLLFTQLEDSGARLETSHFRSVLHPRGYRAVMAAIRRDRPDWIVGNFGKEYWPLILCGRLAGIPVALFRHRQPPMKRLSGYGVPRLAQRFFAVSDYARSTYLERGVPPDRVQVLHNPVNTERFRPDPARRQALQRALGIPADAIVLGYSGRIHGGKGVFRLLEAVEPVMQAEPRLHCLWIGDGPGLRELRERAAAGGAPGRHHFTGWVADVESYLPSLSMLCFPSSAPETFGRVSIEAQACGVPVLASDVGGARETLQAGVTGMLLPPDDVDAWRAAIAQMCRPELRARMAAAARPFVLTSFSMPVIAQRFVDELADAGAARS